MKIGIFTARLIYGGGEKVQNWLAHQILDAGDEVVYLTPEINDSYNEKLSKIGLLGKVDVCQYPLYLKKKRPFRFLKSMREIYEKHALDAIVIFGGSLMEEIAARQVGVKVILAERSNPKWRSIPSQMLKKIQYMFGDGYVFQTEEQAECYRLSVRNNYTVILNPIIDELPEPTTTIRKEIVTVGRLSTEKNVLGTLNAFQRFYQTHKDFKLILYGSGPLEDEINKRVEEMGLQNIVSIVKGKTNIAELINGASLFVFNSTNEGMPNALIEAMSVGLPCISSDCPIYGPRALIKDGVNGFLIPVNDDAALYEKMCKVIDNQFLSSNIRTEAIKIRGRLNKETIAAEWLDYFSEIIRS